MPLLSSVPSRSDSWTAAGFSRSASLASRFSIAVAASLFVAACAHLSVPLTPVPFTLQPFAVLLVGMVLGPATGFAALAAYLLEGASGLPVFTPGALTGVARLAGPTGGYLFIYPVVAAMAGVLPRLLRSRSFGAYAAGGLVALTVLYASGSMWLGHVTGLPFSFALRTGVLPFAVSDLIKVCAAAGIASAWSARARRA